MNRKEMARDALDNGYQVMWDGMVSGDMKMFKQGFNHVIEVAHRKVVVEKLLLNRRIAYKKMKSKLKVQYRKEGKSPDEIKELINVKKREFDKAIADL